MTGFRTDRTGRSTPRRRSHRETAVNRPRGAFIYYELELLNSAAWAALSINGRRVVERVQIEHVRHGGYENGRLPVTYSDFEGAGIRRKYIAGAIAEAEALGLIERTRRGRKKHGKHPGTASEFRLTFVGTIAPTEVQPATDEWRRFASPREAKAHAAKVIQATGEANHVEWNILQRA
jgi:hypothetical protein